MYYKIITISWQYEQILYIFGVISFPSQNCNYLAKMWPEGQVHIFGPMTFDITKLYQTTSNSYQQ